MPLISISHQTEILFLWLAILDNHFETLALLFWKEGEIIPAKTPAKKQLCKTN